MWRGDGGAPVGGDSEGGGKAPVSALHSPPRPTSRAEPAAARHASPRRRPGPRSGLRGAAPRRRGRGLRVGGGGGGGWRVGCLEGGDVAAEVVDGGPLPRKR